MLKQFLTTCAELLYPKSCHICSNILKRQTSVFDDYICGKCSRAMKQAPVTSYSYVAEKTFPYQKLIACYLYEGPTKELVHKFKYGNRPYLSKTIIKLMIEALNPQHFQDIDYLVPVPLHPVRLREREFNQAELIASGLSDHFKKPVRLGLKRIKNTGSQVSLNRRGRILNLKGAFAPVDLSGLKGSRVLVIDDVVTTTATVREASRVLKNAGVEHISVLAFARG